MSLRTFVQPKTTRKFKKDDTGRVSVIGAPIGSPLSARPAENPFVSIVPGYGSDNRNAYVWIGSDEAGCYTHIPLSTLKRLIKSSESK